MSILDPLTCGFAKVVAYELVTVKSLQPFDYDQSITSLQSKLLLQQIRQYEHIFQNCLDSFQVNSETHRRNFHLINVSHQFSSAFSRLI